MKSKKFPSLFLIRRADPLLCLSGVHSVQFLDHALHDGAPAAQVILKFAVTGLVDLVQQVLLMLLQKFLEQLHFLVGQPKFHGDLRTISMQLRQF
jgi:hypothetical protein